MARPTSTQTLHDLMAKLTSQAAKTTSPTGGLDLANRGQQLFRELLHPLSPSDVTHELELLGDDAGPVGTPLAGKHPLPSEAVRQRFDVFMSDLEERWIHYVRETFNAVEAFSTDHRKTLVAMRAKHLLSAMEEGITDDEKILAHRVGEKMIGPLDLTMSAPSVGMLVFNGAIQPMPLLVHDDQSADDATTLYETQMRLIARAGGAKAWLWFTEMTKTKKATIILRDEQSGAEEEAADGTETRDFMLALVEREGELPRSYMAVISGDGIDLPRTLGPWQEGSISGGPLYHMLRPDNAAPTQQPLPTPSPQDN